jgi:UDP-GlcNAc:undecaprenyl-phosphate GlcNAc-1-phosphate transferase
VLRQYFVLLLVAFLGALLVSTVLTPFVRNLALRWGAIDKPSTRKIHASPVPRLGGLAIWLALWVAALVTIRFVPGDTVVAPRGTLPEVAALFGGATVILWIGLADDRRGEMAPLTKIVGQLVACTILILGIRLTVFGVDWLDIPLSYLWVLGLTNALNLLDNMDGLSAGATSIAGAFFLLLAVINGQLFVALLAATLVGACLGFLIYNYNPASIFMGDTGSLSLGFMLAVLGMKLQIHSARNFSFLIAALVLSVPIFDTAFVIWRRVSEGRRVMQGGTDHTSHRLVRLGLNQKQAVWALYGISFLGGLTALVASQGSTWAALLIAVPFAAFVTWAGWRLARVDVAPAQ